MKRIVIVIICALGMFACSEKRPSVVEHPVFDVWYNGLLEINKIELSDTATVLYFDASFRPKGQIILEKTAYIRESGSTEKLHVVRAEGLELDRTFEMSPTGEASFKLYFPPLKPNVARIDFIDNDNVGCCFKIWGIQLSNKSKVEFETPPSTLASKVGQPLPEPVYSREKATIRGKYLGYVKELDMKFNCSGAELLSSDRDGVNLAVADDGSFEGEVPLNFPEIVNSSAGSIFLVPGETQEIYIDLKKKSRFQSRFRRDKEAGDSAHVYFAGSYFSPAEIRQLRSVTRPDLVDLRELIGKVGSMTPDQYKEYLFAAYNAKLAAVPPEFSPNVQRLVKSALNKKLCELLLRYDKLVEASFKRDGLKDRKPDRLEPEYYSFLNKLIDKDIAYSGYHLLIDVPSVEAFSLPDRPVGEQYAHFKATVAPTLKPEQNEILFELFHTSLYANKFKSTDFFTDADKQEIRSVFKNRELAEALIAENDRIYEIMKSNMEKGICETPKVEESKVFDAILAKYRGKVVLVDFWATWCGPCVRANRDIKPYKDKMKGKDVVFVCLAGENSPLLDWHRMIPDIHGEHYRVSNQQWVYWYSAFGIEGVPTFMVYDKSGKQTFKSTGFPGVDDIGKEIAKNL